MRLAAMQINGGAENRDMRHDKRVQHDLPPTQIEHAMSKKLKQRIEQGNVPNRKSKKQLK